MAAMTGGETFEALLTRLRSELNAPGLCFAEPPVRLMGGFDALILRFTLHGGPPELSGPLVARIFSDPAGGARASREGEWHRALAGEGFPVPTALHVSAAESDPGAFVVMPLVEGKTLLSAMANPRVLWKTPRLLAELHARLHSLDASRVAADERSAAMANWPMMLRAQAEQAGVTGFEDALNWADSNAPSPVDQSVLHLDFHPGNVMMRDGRVSGVLDWANATTGDRAADVGTTLVLMTMGPLDAPRGAAPVLEQARKWLARRYLAEYQRIHPVERERVRYYEARRCLTAMVHLAIRRAGATLGEREQYAWDGPQQIRSMTRRFEEISGVKLPEIAPRA